MELLKEGQLFYFAFGSNMCHTSLTKRRKVTPSKSFPATIDGYFLNFDTIALPYFEPCFGSIGKSQILPDQPKVHGVLHLITEKDMKRIILTEGGGGNKDVGYQTHLVECRTYDGQIVTATTLIEVPANHYHDRFFPSERYLKLLQAGAKEHNLAPEYQEWLAKCPRYVASKRLDHRFGRYLYYSVLFVVLFPFLATIGIAKVIKAKPPRFAFAYAEILKKGVIGMYTFVLRPVFGDGCGEISSKDLKAKL